MAIDRVPALKRCRALGLEPAVIGRSKESNFRYSTMLAVFALIFL